MKYDSHGEFVFDWGWADAYERTGRAYYPKLVASIPFTPATGAAPAAARPARNRGVASALIDAARGTADELGASSLHVLFPTEPERARARPRGLPDAQELSVPLAQPRLRAISTSSSAASAPTSARRPSASAGASQRPEIVFEHLRGDEPTPADWDAIFEFYARTFLRRGREPYLNREFFDEIATTMPENLLVVLARHHGAPIAAAICFRGGTTLYGRYWGSLADFHSLHFETCYYQGIDYCIREGLERFEPGTQGEHKIAAASRRNPRGRAIGCATRTFMRPWPTFLERETRHVDAYMDELGEHVPYRSNARRRRRRRLTRRIAPWDRCAGSRATRAPTRFRRRARR